MTGEKKLLNELRLLNIALKRGMNAVCDDGKRVPSVSNMVLHFLYVHGGSAPQKDIENEFGLRRSSASELLGRLEREGYITREVREADARSKKIRLTDRAEAEQKEITDKFAEMENYLESALTLEEKRTFFLLCEKIRALLEPVRNSRGGE